MKTKSIISPLLLLTFLMGVFFVGCDRERLSQNFDASFSENQAFAEATFNDVKEIADEAATGTMSAYKTSGVTGQCATITHDTSTSPHILRIDFGSTNCLCNDGRNRRGAIIVTYTGRYRDAGHTHTFSFDDYHVNDNQVLGTKTVTNMGGQEGGNPYFSIEVNGSIVLSEGRGTITQVSTRTREWLEGSETLDPFDDVYLITGSATGQTRKGDQYSASVIEPLRKEIGCRWLVSGIIRMEIDGQHTRERDYGTGECDNQATVIVNGTERTITLR